MDFGYCVVYLYLVWWCGVLFWVCLLLGLLIGLLRFGFVVCCFDCLLFIELIPGVACFTCFDCLGVIACQCFAFNW